MQQSASEKIMKGMTAFSAVCMAASIWLYWRSASEVWMAAAITAGTFLYHFAMRLAVGFVVHNLIKTTLDYKGKWFLLRRWEPEFYKKIGIKQWKNKLPTYYPQDFSPKSHSISELLQTMCISEIGHEVMLVLSFAPLILSVWFGEFGVFLITSLCAGAIDLVFVLVQRYNRDRLAKIAERKKSRSSQTRKAGSNV